MNPKIQAGSDQVDLAEVGSKILEPSHLQVLGWNWVRQVKNGVRHAIGLRGHALSLRHGQEQADVITHKRVQVVGATLVLWPPAMAMVAVEAPRDHLDRWPMVKGGEWSCSDGRKVAIRREDRRKVSRG